MRTVAVVTATALLAAPAAFGHHSDAALDMKTVVTVEGTVREFSWRNPHAYFVVDARNEAGVPVQWTVQLPSTITMARQGWTRESLAPGDEVTVGLHPARDGRSYGLFQSIERNGEMISSFDRRSGELRFENAAVTEHATSIEGRWMADNEKLAGYPGGLDNITRSLLELTPEAQAALDAYDENSAEDPLLECIGRPTPALILYTNLYPLEIERNEAAQTITIRSQFFDEERIVYMDGRSHPGPNERTLEGHSIGHWDGDALVVDTTNFSAHRSPYQNGIPSGPRKHVIERYQLLPGNTRMSVEFTLEDPDYIVTPLMHRRELIYSPRVQMSPFDCDLESARRFLPR